MKKAIALIVILLASLSGCARKNIAGHWTAKMDMTDYMNAEATGLSEGFQMKDLSLVMNMDFQKDGTFERSLDRDSCVAFYEAMCQQIVESMLPVYEQMIQERNLNISAQELMEASGITVENIIKQYESSFDINAMVNDSRITGKYRVSGKKILIKRTGDVGEFKEAGTIDENTLTFTDFGLDDRYARYCPLAFIKE